jgi:CRP-like cAMP-binding protein
MSSLMSPGAGTFMARLSRRVHSEVLALGQLRFYGDGDYLIRHGAEDHFAVVLRTAQVKVMAETASGRSCLLGIRRAGDLVGELAILDAKPRCASVIADGPVSAFTIPGPQFRTLLERHPIVALEVARTVVGRLRHADTRRVDFTYPVPVRVVRLLAEQAAEAGYGRRRAAIRLTQREVADLIGASEVAVQKAVRDLAASGLVRTGYGVLFVPNPRRLIAEAQRLMETHHRL